MRNPSVVARSVCAALIVAVLATGVGIPTHGHADHRGDHEHVTAEDHGHGVVLVQREMRTERTAPPLQMPAVGPVRRSAPTPPAVLVASSRLAPAPRGRSPPPSPLPRAPPEHL